MPNLETISYSGISHHTLELTSSPESHDFYTKWGHEAGIKEKTVIVNHIIIVPGLYITAVKTILKLLAKYDISFFRNFSKITKRI